MVRVKRNGFILAAFKVFKGILKWLFVKCSVAKGPNDSRRLCKGK
jgi:hypothetical protein